MAIGCGADLRPGERQTKRGDLKPMRRSMAICRLDYLQLGGLEFALQRNRALLCKGNDWVQFHLDLL